MSQIRKFDGGGGTADLTTPKEDTKPKTYGKLIFGGQEITTTDDILAQIQADGANKDATTKLVYADIIDSLRAGNTVTFDPLTNQISGVGWKHIDQKTLDKSKSLQPWGNKEQRKAGWYSLWDNKVHQFNSGLADFGRLNFVKRTETPETPEYKLSLFGSMNPFEYEEGEDGAFTFSQSPLNARNRQYLEAYQDLMNLSEEDARKKYDITDMDKYRAYMAWVNQYGKNYPFFDGENSLWNRIQTKNYNQYDDNLLNLLGWSFDNNKPEDSANTPIPHSYEGSGFNEDALKKADYYIRKGEDGNDYLYQMSADGQTLTPVQDNIWLDNYDWARGTAYDQGVVYGNGRLWTRDQAWNQDTAAKRAIQETLAPYLNGYDENGNWSMDTYLNNMNRSSWLYSGKGKASPFLYQDPNETVLQDFLHLRNPMWYQDITGGYNVPDNQKIIAFVDQDKDGNVTLDNFHRPVIKYAYSGDPNKTIFQSISELQSYLNGLPSPITSNTGVIFPEHLNQWKITTSEDGRQFALTHTPVTVKNNDGTTSNMNLYYNLSDGLYYLLGQNKKFYPITKELLAKINAGETITQNEYTHGKSNTPSQVGTSKSTSFLDVVNPMSVKKHGGKLQKFQFGGTVSYIPTVVKSQKPTEDTVGTLHTVGGGPGLTDTSDKWAAWATGLDTASFGASFIPGLGNIAGAVTGALGSGARFISDIKRDGLGWDDIGRLGVNLGLDILTFIPFAGSAAKAAKMSKAAKSALKFGKNVEKAKEATKATKGLLSASDVVKLPSFKGIDVGKKTKAFGRALEVGLPAWGVAEGVGATVDAIKDGELTTDEMASIANGLISAALLKRGVGKAIDRKALKAAEKKLGIDVISNKPYTASFKNKDGKDITVKITPDQAVNLKGKRKKELVKELETIARNQGADLEKTGIKAEDLIDRFKLDMKNGLLSRIWPSTNKFTPPKAEKLDVFSTEALSNKKLAEALQGENLGFWDKRAARAYQYGLSRNADALSAIENATGRRLIAIPKRTFGGWGLEWTPNKTNIAPKQPVLMLPAWNPPTTSTTTEPIITPYNPVANAMHNSKGQLLLPRGDGKFFAKVQKAPIYQYRPEIQNPLSAARTTGKDQSIKNAQRSLNLHSAQAKKRFEQSPERLIGNLLSGNLRTQDEVIDYILKNVPKNKQQQMLDLFFNKAEFKELLSKVASQSGFSNYAKVVESLPNWLKFKQGGKIVKAQGGTKIFGDYLNTFEPTADKNPWDLNKNGIILNNDNTVNWNQTYAKGSTYDQLRTIYQENWNNPLFAPVKQAYIKQLSANNPELGIKDLTLDQFNQITSDQNLGWGHNLFNDAYESWNKIQNPSVDISVDSEINVPDVEINFPELNARELPLFNKDGSYMNDEQRKAFWENSSNTTPDKTSQEEEEEEDEDDSYGSLPKNWKFNWNNIDVDTLLGGVELARSLTANNRMYNDLIDAQHAVYRDMPTEIYDRYQDHITPVYQQIASQLRSYIPTSTDQLTNYAIRQSRQDAADAKEAEGRLAASQEYSNYLANDLAARRAYADKRSDIAFYNQQQAANLAQRKAELEHARDLANDNSWKNFTQEIRHKIDQDRQVYSNFLRTEDQLRAETAYDNTIREALQKGGWNEKWAAEENKDAYIDIRDWMSQKYAAAWSEINKNATEAAIASRQYGTKNYLRYPWLFNFDSTANESSEHTPSTNIPYKKGGKVTRYTGPKPDDAIWIQHNRAALKAIEKIHDGVLKLFMKAIS